RTKLVVCRTPGSYAARNEAVKAASGSVLAFTDADCEPAPDWISAGVAELQRLSDSSIVGGEVRFAEPAKRSGTALYQMSVGFQQEENIRDRGFSATANLFCSYATFMRIGPFNELLLSGGDREWAWRARNL